MEDIALASLPRGVDSEADSEAESSSISNTDSVSDVSQTSKRFIYSRSIDWRVEEPLPMQYPEPFPPVDSKFLGDEKTVATNFSGLDSSIDKTIQRRKWHRHVTECTIEKLTENEATELTDKAFEAGIEPSDPVVIQLNQRLDFLNGVFGASRSVLHTCDDCGKEFKRQSDLTKHLKTHSRPWKCTVEKCKYFDLGWPTEKERNRHINDKHSDSPAQYKCSYPTCKYASKRESNLKQHMEKVHGWDYLRHKFNRKREINPPSEDLGWPQGSPTSIVSPSMRQMNHAPFSLMADSDIKNIGSSLNLAPSSSQKSAAESDPLALHIEATSIHNNVFESWTTKKNDSNYQISPNDSTVPPRPTNPTPLLLSKSTGEKDSDSASRTRPYSRTGPSSYWSVADQNNFQRNVAHFGTDWAAIASHMGTKTQTMVKNQYLRLVEGRQAPELERKAAEADSRRKRGENAGPPSTQSPVDNLEYSLTSDQDSQAQGQSPKPDGLSHVPIMPPPEHPIQPTDQETMHPSSFPKKPIRRERLDKLKRGLLYLKEPGEPAKTVTSSPASRLPHPSNFPETLAYDKHDLDHKSTQDFVCSHCGKTCARSGDLARHMKLHSP